MTKIMMSPPAENTGKGRSYPQIDPAARFTPSDFADIIRQIPESCPLVGRQAVAWWAQRYQIKPRVGDAEQTLTSRDIDFWGGRSELIELARRLHRKPVFP